jgi:dTDP-4-dehydrorhamnose reductase
MSRVLILGNGLLGTELHKQSGYDVICKEHDGFDITRYDTFDLLLEVESKTIKYCKYDIIINTIAHTDTYSTDRDIHWNVNYKGLSDLVEFCNQWRVKLVHIVSDYIYANSNSNASETDVPVHNATWYAYTKLLGDGYVQLKCNDYLLIRTTHKPYPFPFDNAWVDQNGNFDYVNVIADKILQLVKKNTSGIYNVGTETKTMYELASKTNASVNKVIIPDTINAPKDVTMDVSKMYGIL